jgi:Leucine-rich repeat (LRR) protein
MMKRTVHLLAAAWAILFLGTTQSLPAQVAAQDSLALVAFYNNTDGPNWTDRTNWLAGPVGTWFGVIVSDQRVSSLKLNGNKLKGSIPAEIGALSSLGVLQLKNNKLEGGIPAVIWDMTNLKDIRISLNALTGSIPPEIKNLKKLEWLVLEYNQLSGPLPHEIGGLTAFTHLYLNNNQFTDSIPSELGNCTLLKELFLQNNQFTGSIPSSFGRLTACYRLYLTNNRLTGTIPSEIGNCISMEELGFDKNQLEGGIPFELGNLAVLIRLYLNTNQLTGQIPPELFGSTDLLTLRLNENQLEGAIPETIGNCTKLQEIYLQQNNFSGAVPASLTNAKSLKTLYLYHNQFTDLPDFSSLAALKNLSVYNNRLTFEDIEPNIGVSGFSYSPQDSVGEAVDTTVAEGQSLALPVHVGGTANQYQWMKNGTAISGATGGVYEITSAGPSDAGNYVCKITNSIAAALTLYSRPVHLTVGGTGVDGPPAQYPAAFALRQNYPNPFNPSTRIDYSLPEPGPVQLKIFDLHGRLIRTLVDEFQAMGAKSAVWNSLDDHGRKTPSGIYFYEIKTGDRSALKKMILVQ